MSYLVHDSINLNINMYKTLNNFIFPLAFIFTVSAQPAGYNTATPDQNSERRDPGRIVNITALQAGSNHYKNGNPGLRLILRYLQIWPVKLHLQFQNQI